MKGRKGREKKNITGYLRIERINSHENGGNVKSLSTKLLPAQPTVTCSSTPVSLLSKITNKF